MAIVLQSHKTTGLDLTGGIECETYTNNGNNGKRVKPYVRAENLGTPVGVMGSSLVVHKDSGNSLIGESPFLENLSGTPGVHDFSQSRPYSTDTVWARMGPEVFLKMGEKACVYLEDMVSNNATVEVIWLEC